MATQVLFFGGAIDGEPRLYASAADYVGGQPAKVRNDGTLDVALLPADFAGIFKNDKFVDNQLGPQVGDGPVQADLDTSIIYGVNKIKFTQGTKSDGTLDTPFLVPGSAGAWAPGQQLYISSGGKWDNQAAAGGDPAFGRCFTAPVAATDPLEALMYR